MSSYFILLHSKWIASPYSWNIYIPGLCGPPLGNVQGTISHIGKDVPILKDLLISVTQPFYRKWVWDEFFIGIHNFQAKSPLYKMWNVLSSSCECFKRALLFDGPTVAKGNGVGFKIFLGFNSAFPPNREQMAPHGWDTELFMKTGMWNWDVEMQCLKGRKENGILVCFYKA